MSSDTTVLEARDLRKYYPVKKFYRTVGTVKALDGVSFKLKKGKTLAVVGESGCGKSTLARLLKQIEPPTEGKVLVNGLEVHSTDSEISQKIQMIFQDPYGSINPRKKAWQIIAEPLIIAEKLSRDMYREKAIEVMTQVGLRPEIADRYPHMFSGGQRQRMGIARALILRPEVIICDEPVSALDVSIQAQVLNLLMSLQKELDLSYLFISHDLSVVRHIADEVMIIYLGKVVEMGSIEDIFQNPKHPYTQLLLSSMPGNKSEKALEDSALELPSPLNPPPGCSFHRRCPHVMDQCKVDVPLGISIEKDSEKDGDEGKRERIVSCHWVNKL